MGMMHASVDRSDDDMTNGVDRHHIRFDESIQPKGRGKGGLQARMDAADLRLAIGSIECGALAVAHTACNAECISERTPWPSSAKERCCARHFSHERPTHARATPSPIPPTNPTSTIP